jgi:hypothetical protein
MERHVTLMGGIINAYKILAENPVGQIQLGVNGRLMLKFIVKK